MLGLYMETPALEIDNFLFRRFCPFIAFENVQNNVQLHINIREDCECMGEGNEFYLSSTNLRLRRSNFFAPFKKKSPGFGCAANRKSQRLISASSSTNEGSGFLCRRYVCCTVVSARVYPRCHGVQATMDSVHPLSLHYIIQRFPNKAGLCSRLCLNLSNYPKTAIS
jgi:hypothetical protein